nr:PREDICTED: probable cytochrome P450 CYP44 [Bemisia tabaci]
MMLKLRWKSHFLCLRSIYRLDPCKKKFFTEISAKDNTHTRPLSEIPGPFCLPVLGNLHLYKLGIYNVLKYHEVLDQLYHKYGPIVKQKIGSKTIIHLFSPDDAKTVYYNEDKTPFVVPLQETIQIYRERGEYSPGLGNTNGETWYRLRNAVRHLMLQPRDVQGYLPGVQSIANDLIETLHSKRDSKNQIITLQDELGKYSQEASGFVCFDRRLGYFSEDKQKHVKDILDANHTVFYNSALLKFSLPFYKYLNTPKWNQLVAAENIIMSNAIRLVNETIENLSALESRGELSNDQFPFMKSLLAKKELSREDVTVITLSLYSDGLSTTVPSLLFNIYCLAMNQDVQETAYKEICEVTKGSKTLTVSMVNQLSYLRAVIKETFRVLPNGVEIARILKKDLLLSNFLVPAETAININMNVHYKSDEFFKDPHTFRPDRWMRGNEGSSINPFVLIPFGHGTRSCTGKRFAEQDMAVVLCKILQNFKLKYPAKEKPLEVVYKTLLFPKDPLRVQFVPR